MAYRKFDDPSLKRANESRKLDPVFPYEALRRSLQGVLNRVFDGNFGTAGTTAAGRAAALATGCQTGGTGGIGVSKPLAVIINGRAGSRASAGSYWLPAGTQSANTYVKYGIFGGTGTSGTVLAGNESTSSTGAYLPDCPDGYVCLGYMEYVAGTVGWNRGANVVTGQTGSSGTATFTDLVHMPMSEI
jgi:hypothetical protein